MYCKMCCLLESICPRIAHLLDIKLFFSIGVKEKKRYIPMYDVALELGDSMSLDPPVIHAVSGCDSPSLFCGVGKKWRLTTMEETLQCLKE